jgi:hypothetical protein
MADAEQIDAASRDYLQTWERRSNLRAQGRYHLSEAAAADLFRAAPADPLQALPEIQALPADSRRFLIAQGVYLMNANVAHLEIAVNGSLAARLATRTRRVEIPWSLRQAALTIDADERYHAYVAREFIEEAARACGIAPALPVDGSPDEMVDRSLAAVPEASRVDLELVALCLVENAITAELLGLRQDEPPKTPFGTVLAEHLADEGRHASFLRQVLTYYWAQLDDEERAAVGPGIPVFLEQVMGVALKTTALAGWLVTVGFAPDEADRLVRLGRPSGPRHENPMWRNMRMVMARAGLLDCPAVRASLAGAGWLAADQAA